MTLAGELALWLALLLAAWSAAMSLVAARGGRAPFAHSGAWASYLVPLLVLLAMSGLASALLRPDFTFRHVADHASLDTPWPYRLSALWAGVDGSLLLWSLALATHGALLTRAVRRHSMRDAALVTCVASTVSVVLLGILVGTAYPYARHAWAPPDGRGLAPELQHAAMALHPPLLHFGYAALVAPFALAIGALLRPRADARWLTLARRWGVASWALLTAAILLGMRWAMLTPGWRSVWQWEPVQVLVLLTWIVAGLLAHSGVIGRRWPAARRALAWLSVLGFPIALLGLASAHAGESGGRHAFRSSPAEAPLVAFMLVTAGAAISIAAWRGSRLPIDDRSIRPGRRSRLSVPTVLSHAGLLVSVIGLAAQGATRIYHAALEPAHTVDLTDPIGGVWSLVSQGESRDRAAGREITVVGLEVAHNRKPLGLLAPEIREFASASGDSVGPMSSEVAHHATALMDMTVMLEELPTNVASLEVAFHPLASWIWVGGLLAVLGAFASLLVDDDE